MKYHKLNKNSNNITQRARYNHPNLIVLVSGAGVTCSHTFVFTTSLPREKKKKNKRPLSRLTPNIGGQILSYEASSLPPEQASCHCRGISSHNSARPSDSVTRAARCFHFFEIPLTNLLYDSVTKKPRLR